MDIRMDEDMFIKNAQCISKTYHEVLMLMNFLQTEPQVKNMNINHYELYYTVLRIRDEKEIIDNQYENDYNILNDFFTPNHYARKKIDEKLKWGKNLRWIISILLSYIKRDAKTNSRKCDVCNIDIYRASYAKHLRSKRHLQNEDKK